MQTRASAFSVNAKGGKFPTLNPFTQPIPQPAANVDNLAACVMALKLNVENLTGQRGSPPDRAVTFTDLVDFGVLTSDAVQSPGGTVPPAGLNLQVGPGLKLDNSTQPPTIDVAVPYLPLSGGTVSGNLTVSGTTTLGLAFGTTVVQHNSTTALATTAWVHNEGFAFLASPAFTGIPTAPTPATSDNSTQLATTAFVKTQGYATTAQLGNYLPLTAGTGVPVTGMVKIDFNSGVANPNAPPAGTMLWLDGADATAPRITLDGHGVQANITFRHAAGTRAAPTATQAGTQILQFAAFGYGATGYSANSRGNFAIAAAENWTDTATGTQARIGTTPIGSTTINQTSAVIDNTGLTLAGYIIRLVNTLPIVSAASNYNYFYDPAANAAFVAGVAPDATNHIRNTTHVIASIAGATNYAIFNANAFSLFSNGAGPGTGSANFGATKWCFRQASGDDASAGVIDYGNFNASYLSIVGKGASINNRWVQIYDNLTVGQINAGAAITAANNFISTGNNAGYFFNNRNGSAVSYGIYADNGWGYLWYSGTGNLFQFAQNNFQPAVNNVATCGSTALAWNQVWSYGFPAPSDRRQKRDIEDLPDCLDLVRAVTPQRYRWNHGPDQQRVHWGFIAQDVGAAMDKAGHQFGGHHAGNSHALEYNQLTAVLWKAVQELAAEMSVLKARAA